MEYTNDLGLVSKPLLRDIADAIREKSGKSIAMTLQEMPKNIKAISGSIIQSSYDEETPVSYITPSITREAQLKKGAPLIYYDASYSAGTAKSSALSVTSCKNGIVLAFLIVRADFNIPEGWELLYDSVKTTDDYSPGTEGGIKQRLIVLSKLPDDDSTKVILSYEFDTFVYSAVWLISFKYKMSLAVYTEGGGVLDDYVYVNKPDSESSIVIFSSVYGNSYSPSWEPTPRIRKYDSNRFVIGIYEANTGSSVKMTPKIGESNVGYLYVVLKVVE